MRSMRETKRRGRGKSAKAKSAARQTRAHNKTRSDAQAGVKPQAEIDDDPPVTDIDAFRLDIARRISVIVANMEHYWRGCPERSCRRARSCRAPHVRCSAAPPLTESTPEESARAMAKVQAALAAFHPEDHRDAGKS